MGNKEFGSWIWKGIELGPEKWEMGTKSEFSSLKVRPQTAAIAVATYSANFAARMESSTMIYVCVCVSWNS